MQVATIYSYDKASNLQTKTNPNGTSVSFTYDGLNRVKTKTLSTGQTLFNYDYDTAPGGIGKLTSVLLQSAVGGQLANDGYSYSGYDALGRPTGGQQVTLGVTYPMTYGYDLAGHMTSETYPSGKTVLTGYDNAGRVNGVTTSAGKTYASGISYTAPGQIAAMTLGNNLVEHTSYNGRLQPTLIGLGTSATDSSTLKLDYTYGVLKTDGTLDLTKNNGNPQSQTITVAAGTIAATVVGIQSYTYDMLNRLAGVSEALTAGGTAAWSQTYSCDRYGNMAVTASPGIPIAPQTPQALNAFNTSTNQIQTPGTIYDASGNQTNDGHGGSYSYDAENYMTSCTVNSVSSSYAYDGNEGRVIKTVGSASPTILVYDIQGRLVAEYGGPTSGSNAGTSYLTTDQLLSTRVVTNQSGVVIARHDYLPFGSEIQSGFGGRTLSQGYNATDDTRQKFTSKERDAETGLDYFGARYYSSAQGRFAGADPLFLELTRQADPQQLNLYSYVRVNPLRFIDPLGLDITVIGSEQDEYARQLQADVSFHVDFGADNKIVIVDSNGNQLDKDALKALGKTLKGADKELFNAITDTKHHVTINAIDAAKEPLVFFGRSDAPHTGEHTIAFGQAALLDQPKNSGGYSSSDLVGHETLEAYFESKGASFQDAHSHASDFFGGLDVGAAKNITAQAIGYMVIGFTGDVRVEGRKTVERIKMEYVTPVPKADFLKGKGAPYKGYPTDVEKIR